MIIYTENNSSRLSYALNEFSRRLGATEVILTTSIEEMRNYNGIKINYSSQNIQNCYQIVPSGLLEETGVRDFKPRSIKWKEQVVFFPNPEGELSFDIFSMIFFFLTRYEEYLPHRKDEHSRYLPENSLLTEHELLQVPVLERVIRQIKKDLLFRFPNEKLAERKFTSLFTFDIDNAYAYLHKGFFRTTGALIKSLLKLQFRQFSERLKVLRGKEKDPYDTYSYIRESTKTILPDTRFFFLLGDRSSHDKNLSHSNDAMVRLINDCNSQTLVGIHPSYQTFGNPEQLKKEINRLQNLINSPVKHSRQHYLRFALPDTFEALQQSGITHDYSMGYASESGFRAGTCLPFLFYNLNTESLTSLVFYPLTTMDGTLNEYQKLDVETAKQKSEELIREIKAVDGMYISLWHNETLTDRGKWKGWKSVFEHQLYLARNSA